MATGYRICAMRGVLLPAEYNAQLAAAVQAVSEANAMADRLTRLNADAWRPELREQYNRVRDELITSRGKLESARSTRTAADFDAARTGAIRVTTGLRALEGALNASIENLSAVQRQARDVDQIINGAEANDRAIDALKVTLPQELTARQQGGQSLPSRARDQGTTREPADNITAVHPAAAGRPGTAARLQ